MPNDTAPKDKRSNPHFVAAVTAIMLVVTLAFIGMNLLQIRDIDNGIVEAVAVEQDGYVQLVLDQINLQPDRSDEEIVDNILGTLDGNSGHYWTFSRDKTMLFVKDENETSRYRSLMADTYFESGSGRDFLDELSAGTVTHDVIDIEGEQFVASGTLFEYAGSTYRLCLLTNRDVMLSSNTMLGSRSRLMVLLYCELGIFLIVTIYLAILVQRARTSTREARAREARLGKSVERLNARLLELGRAGGAPAAAAAPSTGRGSSATSMSGAPDASAGERAPKQDGASATPLEAPGAPTGATHREVLEERLLPLFQKHTADQGVSCEKLTVDCADEVCRQEFIKRAEWLDSNVLLFSDTSEHVVLLKIGSKGEPLSNQVAALLGSGMSIAEG